MTTLVTSVRCPQCGGPVKHVVHAKTQEHVLLCVQHPACQGCVPWATAEEMADLRKRYDDLLEVHERKVRDMAVLRDELTQERDKWSAATLGVPRHISECLAGLLVARRLARLKGGET